MTLNPKQQDLSKGLLDVGGVRPNFRPDLAADLHEHIEASLEGADPPDADARQLRVTKYDLAEIHSCEARWFGKVWEGWSVEMLTGTVAHRAIERIIISGYSKEPLDVIRQVLERMETEDKPPGSAEFLSTASDEEKDDLIGEANNHVVAFLGDWPPLSLGWKPRLESSRTYEDLFGGAVVLSAKYDLALGLPEGCTARTLITDVKTGKQHLGHPGDLRYYALVETLRQEVPPFRVASYYTRSGKYVVEDVKEETLFQTADLLVDGVRKMWELRARSREPSKVPSGLCSYCGLLNECEDGRVFLRRRDAA